MNAKYLTLFSLVYALTAATVLGQIPAPAPPLWHLADKTEVDEEWMVKFLADGPKARPGPEFDARWKKLEGAVLDGIKLANLVMRAAQASGADTTMIVRSLSFQKTSLKKADLENLAIGSCDFTRADLSESNLSGTYWNWTTLEFTSFTKAELGGAVFDSVDANNAVFNEAKLRGVVFEESHLDFAWFWRAVAPCMEFYNSKALSAHFPLADFSGAIFLDMNLTGAHFGKATLRNVQWDAHGLPHLGALSTAKDLETIHFVNSEFGLVELRKGLMEAGLRNTERQINYAIQHTRTDRLWALGEDGNGPTRWDRIEAGFRKVCYDWPCSYGLHPGAALGWLALLCVGCTIPYAAIMFRQPRILVVNSSTTVPDTSRSGIWAVPLEKCVASPAAGTALVHVNLPTGFRWQALPGALWYACSRGLFFSLISAFSTGYKDLDVGRWIERIKPRETTLRPTGWVRTLSGFQSLLSFGLLVVWLLTYFGRPFE